MKLLLVTAVCFSICAAFEDTVADSSDGSSRLVSELPELLSSEEEIENIYKEFEEVETGKRCEWSVAELPENIKKNRYEDLLACDHSRVILKIHNDDPHSDYINANYIDGQNSKREYIATQGPLSSTIHDFWRMILQENVTSIVMLANLIEHGKEKVAKYWPDTSDIYDDIEVRKVSEHSIPRVQHTVRTFDVKKEGSQGLHTVRQFHFTGWPDMGVPKDRLSIISIIRQAKLYDPSNKAPIVVHCSAGIGRTGTLILMDSMMEKAKQDGKVDFQKRLDHMRTLRPEVVEKKEQYLFAYQAVNDKFNVDETSNKLEEIEEEYKKLDKECGDD